jgi:hypothetical protein
LPAVPDKTDRFERELTMTLRRAFNLEGSEISLVQNRLNVATLGLTALVFSGSFTLALFGSLRLGAQSDFRVEFLHTLVALAIGITTSLASIACFLQSQHSEPQAIEDSSESSRTSTSKPHWFHTRQWWFCLGQIFLYMALAQALSASLTEVVYGVSLSRDGLGLALGVLASPLWWVFLFFGPVMFLRRMWPFQTRSERSAVLIVYVLTLVTVLGISASAWSTRGGGAFARSFVEQLYQPLTWHQGWVD